MTAAASPLSARLVIAALVVLLYLALCAAVWARERGKRRALVAREAALAPAARDATPWLVAHASQTGQAEAIAWQTAQGLHAAGVPARVMALNAVTAATLAQASRAVFIVSTYGEGDPPDAATLFARRLMTGRLALGQLQCAVLALGDRGYANFCGFGRALDRWLAGCGTRPLFERIDVDAGDALALQRWRRELGRSAGTDDLSDESVEGAGASGWRPWRLVVRRHLNPGGQGGPMMHLEFEPADGGALPGWEAGDLVQVQPPAPADGKRGDYSEGRAEGSADGSSDDGRSARPTAAPRRPDTRPREYSIASIPADGRLHLMVRRERRTDGRPGLVSGWLTDGLALGAEALLRVRAHPAFRIDANVGRPLILVGNGSGLGGLRAHLKGGAARGGARHWLVYGERQSAFDAHHAEELAAWRRSGMLQRCDLVFSRDQAERRHVQHRLREEAEVLRAWIAEGAAVYVCGSLEGMAGAVDAALHEIVGTDAVNALVEAGRYRRDVY